MVRFDDNDYSVPVRFAHHPIVIKGYVDRVVLCHQGYQVAEHRRSWSKEGVFFDYTHYLALLEKKPGALDHALPLSSLNLPECFETLRRRLEVESETVGEGVREYIRVLRLLEDYSRVEVSRAVENGLKIRVHRRDAIVLFLRPDHSLQWPGRDHLAWVQVASPDLSAYCALLSPGGGS